MFRQCDVARMPEPGRGDVPPAAASMDIDLAVVQAPAGFPPTPRCHGARAPSRRSHQRRSGAVESADPTNATARERSEGGVIASI